MAFTNQDDINILQSSDIAVVGAGAGNDRYVVTAATLTAGKSIQISDTQGTNTLQLVGGLVITSSIVGPSGVLLTLNNGATIEVLGANNNFSFLTGGDPLSGTGGTSQTFSQFVTQSLGVAAVPTTGTATGTSVTVNANGGTTAGGTTGPTPGIPGQTFTLTTGPNTFVGTNNDDVFDGATNQNVNNNNPTLNSFDNLNGGAGFDTVVTGPQQGVNGGVADVDFSGVTSVERLIASSTGGAITLNTQAQRAGITDVIANGGANLTLGAGYTNEAIRFAGSLNAIDQVALNNAAAGTNFRVTFTSAEVGNGAVNDGSATAPQDGGLAVRLQKEDGADALTGGVSRYEDEGVSFFSADNTARFDVRDISGTQRGGAFQGVVLGTQAGDLFNGGNLQGQTANSAVYVNGGGGNDTLTSGDASDFLVGGAGDDNLTSQMGDDSVIGGDGNDTVAGGAGNDSILGGAGNDQLNGGAGNELVNGDAGDDLVTVNNGQLNLEDTLIGGDGTDTVAFASGADFNTAQLAARVTGFERLQANSGGSTYDASRIAGINQVVANHNTNNVVTFSNLSATQSLRLTEALVGGNDDVAATLMTDTAADSINVSIGATTPNGATGSAAGALTLNSHETINIASAGGTAAAVNSIANLVSAAVTSIVVTGDRALTLTDINTGAANNRLDASALTANLNQNAVLDGTSGHTILGGSGNDTLRGAGGADQITGGAGNDNITGGAGNNTIDGGAGNDTVLGDAGNEALSGGEGDDLITGGTGNDNLNGGAGNDRFVVNVTAANVMDLTNTDTLAGGEGTDFARLAFGDFALDLSQNTENRLGNITGLEGLELDANAGNNDSLTLGDIALGAFTGNVISITHVDGDADGITLNFGGIVNNTARVNYTGNDGVTGYTVGNNVDNANLGAGNDGLTVLNTLFLQATDTVNGGAGDDSVSVRSGAALAAVSSAQLANISSFETFDANFAAATAGDVSFTLTDAVAQANRNLVTNTLAVTATEAGGTGRLIVDGSAVTASVGLLMDSSGRADTLTGGAGNDRVNIAANELVLGESLTGGNGTDTLRFTGNNSFSGATIAGFEVIEFNNNGVVALTALASVLDGVTFSVIEEAANNDVNTITLTPNGDSSIDLSRITTPTGNNAANDQIIVNYSVLSNIELANTHIGSGLADVVTGGNQADTISGGVGNDTLMGGAGGDVLNGGVGDDVLNGGGGLDQMTGGTGTNTFRFAAAADVTANTPDVITDFDASTTNILSFNGAAAPGFGLVGGNAISHAEVATNGFTNANNVVVITTAVGGALTSANAATAIGNATGNYVAGDNVLFIVSNNTDSAVFRFTSGGGDNTVTAAELGAGPIISLVGVNTAELVATDANNYVLMA